MYTDYICKENVSIFFSLQEECVLSRFICVQLFATLWTIAHQALLSIRFSRQEYWSGLSCPSPGYLPNSGIEPASLESPALAGGFFISGTPCAYS